MLDANKLKEIEAHIAVLEMDESSYDNYAKLMILKAARGDFDKAEITPTVNMYSAHGADDVVGEYGDSDFLLAVAGKDCADAWCVIDDLMDTLRVANVRVYNSIMVKIQSLR